MAQRLPTPIPLSEALARMAGAIRPVEPHWGYPWDVLGAWAAEDIRAPNPMPMALVATRDGWAVTAEHTYGASPGAPVPLPSPPRHVRTGEYIATGSDAVLPLNAVNPDGWEVLQPAAPGDGTAAPGTDVAVGALLARAGDMINRRTVAAMTVARVEAVDVRRPRFGIVPVRWQNMVLPPKNFQAFRHEAEWDAAATPADLAEFLRRPRDHTDAIIINGGTGEGPDDWTVDVLRDVGEVLFHGVALDPGGTSAFALVGGRPVLAVPRRPQAVTAALELLGIPLLRHLAGASDAPEPLVRGPLTRKIAALPGLTRLVYARQDGEAIVPLGGVDLPLTTLAQAQGFVLVPPSSEGYPPGSVVAMTLFQA